MQPQRSTVGLCALIGLLSATLSNAYSFLFISAPTEPAIYSSRLLNAVQQSRNDKMSSSKLTGLEIIKEPRGLAVDSLRKILYAIDGNGGQPQLYASRIYYSKDGNVGCEAPKLIAVGLSSNWVAVDFRGQVFFVADNDLKSMDVSYVTNKLDGTVVEKITGDPNKDEAAKADTEAKSDSEEAEKDPITVVYEGASVTGVSMPHGIAVDGYRLFWANGENGKQDGTIVQGLQDPMGDAKVTPLATNLAMAHGVCLTSSRVFFSDEEQNLFSTKVNGGKAEPVTDKLQKPRGCAFDGDGTVFVADAGDNKVLSFAGAGAELGPRRLSTSLTNIKEPFGLAVLHGSRENLDSGASRSAAVIGVAAALLALFL